MAFGVFACAGPRSPCQSSGSASPGATPSSVSPSVPAKAHDVAAPGLGASPAGDPTIVLLPGGTSKVEQLLGEEDKELHQLTRSRTWSRFGIRGTDLGSSFDHAGRAYFLFGDTVGVLDRALDTIATTDSRDPEAGVALQFLIQGDHYLTVQPPGISMGAFEVPVSGIDLSGRVFVIVRTNHTQKKGDWSTDRTVLTEFVAPSDFRPIRRMSDRFQTMSMHAQPIPDSSVGLPAGGPFVFVWATSTYRKSDLFLFVVPLAHFEDGAGTLYFSGVGATGVPSWSPRESDAAPVVADGTLGDVSVTWCKELQLWLMTYDHRAPVGIYFQYSRTPWGPWSARQQLLRRTDGAKFIHDPASAEDDGLGGPVIGGSNDPHTTPGGMYAPYVVERWTKVKAGELVVYYTLSTWNPYVVVLMKSSFQVHEP
jgi:hypothetical protein